MGIAQRASPGQNTQVMLTGDQICAGRGPLKLSQAELARRVEVSRDTIVRAEKAGAEVPRFLSSGTMLDIVRVFEAGGWTFHVDGSLASGVGMEHPALSGRGLTPQQVDNLKKIGFGPKAREVINRRAEINQYAAAVGMTDEQVKALGGMASEALRRMGSSFDPISFHKAGVDFFASERRMPTLDDLLPPGGTGVRLRTKADD